MLSWDTQELNGHQEGLGKSRQDPLAHLHIPCFGLGVF